MTSGAYASTTVAVESSQAAIRRLLVNYGADSFEFGEGMVDGVRHAAIGFTAQGRRVRMRVALKLTDPNALAKRQQRARSPERRSELRAEMDEQEARRIWRVLHWCIKSRMEAVAEDVETFEQAFLSHLVDERSGETVYETLVRQGSVDLGAPLLALNPA